MRHVREVDVFMNWKTPYRCLPESHYFRIWIPFRSDSQSPIIVRSPNLSIVPLSCVQMFWISLLHFKILEFIILMGWKSEISSVPILKSNTESDFVGPTRCGVYRIQVKSLCSHVHRPWLNRTVTTAPRYRVLTHPNWFLHESCNVKRNHHVSIGKVLFVYVYSFKEFRFEGVFHGRFTHDSLLRVVKEFTLSEGRIHVIVKIKEKIFCLF